MPEVFRTGRTNVTKIILPFLLGPFAVVFAWVAVQAAVHEGRSSIFGSTVSGAVALLFGFLAVSFLLDWLNSFVGLSPEGLLWQNRYRRQLFIPWSAVKGVVITHWGKSGEASIRYLDTRGRMRKKALWQNTMMSVRDDPLFQAILRYKTFPSRRERWAGFQEIYEE